MTDHRAPPRSVPRVLIALVALCTLIEAVLLLGDVGLLGDTRLRTTAYAYGAFWPELLRDWRPSYPGQPYLMFASYAFLHGGLLHLLINMITLISLGRAVCDRAGPRGFALLYAAAVLGGALAFGILTRSAQPMVGASGGLFGLVGGLLAWAYIDRRIQIVIRAVLVLVALNLLLWWLLDGFLAWETHLGGFVAGWMVVVLIKEKP